MKAEQIKKIAISIAVAVLVTIIANYIIMKISGALKPIIPGQKIRGCDPQGCGYFGASRGSRKHMGLDIVARPGETISSPITGKVTRYPYPYGDDLRYKGIEIVNQQYKIKMFYVDAFTQIGTEVKAGQPIGIAQDIASKYDGGMTNHVHVEVYKNGVAVDPAGLFV